MIRLKFERDDDGTGELRVVASANGFAGVGAAWFNAEELESFASRLAEYPLREPGPALTGGLYGNGPVATLSQELVGMAACRVDSRGQIGVQVRLATAALDEDRPESHHSVHLEVLTTYNHLTRFVSELRAVLRGEAPEALLEGEDLG